MSNGKTHTVVGAMAGATVALVDNNKHPLSHNLLSSPALGMIMGKLPDIIEPASNPHHRQFFHSLTTLTVIATGLVKTYNWSPKSPMEQFIRGVVLIGGAGYISHLLCDATTPRGLPIVGKL